MSNSLAYGVGAGGTDRWDKEVDVDAIKKGVAPLLKKSTYTDPLKRLSWPKRGSKSRGNSIETPADQGTTSPMNAPEILQSDEVPDPATATAAITEDNVTSTQTQVSYHSLDSTSPTPQLSAILSLSNTIFSSTPDSTKYSSISTWQSHISTPNSIVFFATLPSPDNEANVQPIGFVYAFPRRPADYADVVRIALTERDEGEVLHIWLAGVVQEHRSMGVFGDLMRLADEFAKEKQFRKMSLATVPSRFGRAFEVLKKEGWTVVGDRNGEGSGSEKVVLMKDVAAGSAEEIGVAR